MQYRKRLTTFAFHMTSIDSTYQHNTNRAESIENIIDNTKECCLPA